VDGEAAEVLRVNGLVRGIALGAGRHRVEMRYRPPGLREGLLLTIASGLCVVLLLVLGNRQRRSASGGALSR